MHEEILNGITQYLQQHGHQTTTTKFTNPIAAHGRIDLNTIIIYLQLNNTISFYPQDITLPLEDPELLQKILKCITLTHS